MKLEIDQGVHDLINILLVFFGVLIFLYGVYCMANRSDSQKYFERMKELEIIQNCTQK